MIFEVTECLLSAGTTLTDDVLTRPKKFEAFWHWTTSFSLKSKELPIIFALIIRRISGTQQLCERVFKKSLTKPAFWFNRGFYFKEAKRLVGLAFEENFFLQGCDVCRGRL